MSEAEIELIALRWRNLVAARHLAARIFPSETHAISRGLLRSLLPSALQPVFGAAGVIDARYELAIAPQAKRRAVGLTGLYMLRDWPSDIWLGWYGIDACARGRGFGRALLKTTIARAQSQGHKTLRLWTTTGSDRTAVAIGLYRAFGFVPQRTGYAYHGHAVEIFSLGLAGPVEPLDLADIASILAGADRHKLARLGGDPAEMDLNRPFS